VASMTSEARRLQEAVRLLRELRRIAAAPFSTSPTTREHILARVDRFLSEQD